VRTIADVLLLDEANVNQTLVKEGWCWCWCWCYRKNAPENATLVRLETEAREARRGLWVELNPISPWELNNNNVAAPTGFEPVF
jgi:endonuclease YncB( thermonuclease family)